MSGRYGLSDSIINGVRQAFCYNEVVRLSIDSPWRDNMKEMALRLEKRTGGTVIDRAGMFSSEYQLLGADVIWFRYQLHIIHKLVCMQFLRQNWLILCPQEHSIVEAVATIPS